MRKKYEIIRGNSIDELEKNVQKAMKFSRYVIPVGGIVVAKDITTVYTQVLMRDNIHYVLYEYFRAWSAGDKAIAAKLFKELPKVTEEKEEEDE